MSTQHKGHILCLVFCCVFRWDFVVFVAVCGLAGWDTAFNQKVVNKWNVNACCGCEQLQAELPSAKVTYQQRCWCNRTLWWTWVSWQCSCDPGSVHPYLLNTLSRCFFVLPTLVSCSSPVDILIGRWRGFLVEFNIPWMPDLRCVQCPALAWAVHTNASVPKSLCSFNVIHGAGIWNHVLPLTPPDR